MGRAGLYVPQNTNGVLDYLTSVAGRHGWSVRTIIWCWKDLLTAMADSEVDLVLATSLSDLPPNRAPRLVFADELPPPTRARDRPRWR